MNIGNFDEMFYSVFASNKDDNQRCPFWIILLPYNALTFMYTLGVLF